MGSMEHLRVLSLRANDMVQEVSSSFEEHFLWLDEVLAEARRTLASEDLLLLPKTPSAAPKKRTRRTIKEDAENSPPVEFITPPSRPGRLCSKLASQKIQQQVRMNITKKLRRPSSPLTEPTTSRRNTRRQAASSHTSNTSRSEDKCSKSPVLAPAEVIPPTKGSQKTVKLVLDSSESSVQQSVFTSSKKDTGSPKKTDSASQESVSSPKKRSSQQNKCQPSLEKENNSHMGDAPVTEHTSSTVSSSTLPQKITIPTEEATCSPQVRSSASKLSCLPKQVTSVDAISSKTQDSNVNQGLVVEQPQNSTKDAVQEDELHLHLDDTYGDIVPPDDVDTGKGREKENMNEKEDMQVVWQSSEVKEKPEVTIQQSPPHIIVNQQTKESSPSQFSSAPSPKVISTKQKAVTTQEVPAAFAPAPRLTRTKQRALDAPPPPIATELQPPSAPAARIRHTKQKTTKVQEAEDRDSDNHSLHPSPAPAPRITRTKQKAAAVPDVSSSTESLPKAALASSPRITHTKQEENLQKASLHSENNHQPSSVPAPRMTRTKQRAIDMQEAPTSMPQPTARVTRTKQKAMEDQQPLIRNLDSEEEEGKSSKGMQQAGKDKGIKSTCLKDSGVHSFGLRAGVWGSAESVPPEESCVTPQHSSPPPRRITRSKMSKLQQAQQSPKAIPSIPNIQRVCCSPRVTASAHSPLKGSSTSRKLGLHTGTDGVMQPSPERARSPLRIVRHSPDKTGKVVDVRLQMVGGSAGRVTPSFISRMQPFLSASSSSASSSSSEHRRIIKRAVGTPNESRRPANIVTGMTSFIKSQPLRPTREEVETQRLQELHRKKEREEDTIRKKQQLLRAKTEEQKRRNEERMRRVQEALQERERLAVAAKEKQERERRQREEEEQQRRKQLAKKKAEDEARKATKLREQQEERKRLEEEKKQRLEEEKKQKLEEEKRRQRLEDEERKRYYDQKKQVEEQLKMKKLAMTHFLKKKHEVESKPAEALAIHKESEQQPLRQQETKTVVSTGKEETLNTTYTASTKENVGGPMNTTYTKPATVTRIDSYEMTPVQPTRSSSSLNNYCIDDIQTDDSTDDDASPKKKIPQWAMKTQLRAAVLQHEHYPPDLDKIFPPTSLLMLPDLTKMFPKQKMRFRKRTSSAQWGTPPSKVFRMNTST